MTWTEIERSPGNHDYDGTDGLCREATKRFEELGLDDREPYQLRIGGKPRIWGFREGRVFKILWWDPNHSVYQVGKRHT